MLVPAAMDAKFFLKGIIQGVRYRLTFRFAVNGDLRFLSHHDTLRLFERALARAEIPVRYSEGFNPRPRISIVLPRSVGVAGCDEMLVVELSREMPADEALERLGQQVPEGISLPSVNLLPMSGTPQPSRAEYILPLAAEHFSLASLKAAELLASTSVKIERKQPKTGSVKRLDIRPYLETISLLEGQLRWTQAILPTGTVRPDEVLEALGLVAREHLHRLCRIKVWYDLPVTGPLISPEVSRQEDHCE